MVSAVSRPLGYARHCALMLSILLAPLWAFFLQVTGFAFYHRFGQISVGMGITRSLLLATVILWIAGVLGRRGARLKL